MRLWLIVLAIVALVAFVVINPVARVLLGTICANCGCGARLSWTWREYLTERAVRFSRQLSILCADSPDVRVVNVGLGPLDWHVGIDPDLRRSQAYQVSPASAAETYA